MDQKNEWLLSSLTITKNWQSNYKGHQEYVGSARFQNGNKMEFAITLDCDKCKRMVAILKEEIVSHAETLGDMIKNSMPVSIGDSDELKQIE